MFEFWELLPTVGRWVIASFLFLFGAATALANAMIVARNHQHGTNMSLIPVLGGLFSAAGLAVAPLPAVRSFWWLPLLLDVPVLLVMAYFLTRERWRRRPTPPG